jgi:hypothetical protein
MRKLLLSLVLILTIVSAGAQTVRRGDANNDKKVDSKDVTEVSNAIMGEPSANYNQKNADVNRDDKVNAADVVVITNMVLDGTTNDSGQRMVLLKKDGTKLFYDLHEEPVTTFSNGQLVLTTSKTTAYFQLSEIIRYTFEGAYEEIGKAKARAGETVYHQTRDAMSFDGLPRGTLVELYTSDGRKLSSQQTSGDATTEVSLADQPRGTYYVKIGDAQYKFEKR